jgi:hypothetical protein
VAGAVGHPSDVIDPRRLDPALADSAELVGLGRVHEIGEEVRPPAVELSLQAPVELPQGRLVEVRLRPHDGLLSVWVELSVQV